MVSSSFYAVTAKDKKLDVMELFLSDLSFFTLNSLRSAFSRNFQMTPACKFTSMAYWVSSTATSAVSDGTLPSMATSAVLPQPSTVLSTCEKAVNHMI